MTARCLKAIGLASRWFVILLLFSPLPTSRAQTPQTTVMHDGNWLYEWCQVSEPKTPIENACWGFIEGAADAWAVMRAAQGGPPCPPAGTTDRQIVDAVMNHLRAHPDQRSYGGAGNVMIAISQTWGCR